MKFKKPLLFLLVTGLFLGGAAVEKSILADQKTPTTSSVEKMLSTIGKTPVIVQKIVNGPEGMVGVAFSRLGETKTRFVWVDDKERYIVPAPIALVDSKGKIWKPGEDKDSIAKKVSVNDRARDAIHYAQKTTVKFEDKNTVAKKTVYAFIDSDCPHCHSFWTIFWNNKPAFKNVHFVFVPVAFVHGDKTAEREATIMNSKNPLVAWNNNELHFDENKEKGGAKRSSDPFEKNKIVKQTIHVEKFLLGVPTFVWTDHKKIHMFEGEDPSEVLKEDK